MLPVFVINLDRSPDRLAHFSQQCTDAGISFERFPAVDGANLPDHLRPYFCDASPLRPAEIGCYASHLGVWRLIAERGIPAALICEDDAILPPAALLSAALECAPHGWDVIRLSAEVQRRIVPVAELPNGRVLARPLRSTTNLVAYCISQAGARKMLRPGLRTLPVDRDMTRSWAFDLCELAVVPPPVVQTVGPSTIGGRSRDRNHVRRIKEKAQRMLWNLRAIGARAMLRAVRAPTHTPATS